MTKAKAGDTVRVHYTGRLADGTEFDTSRDRDPLTFTLGEQRIIRGFEEAVLGMEPGETKQVTISAEDAYGPYRDDLVQKVERDRIPPAIPLEKGERLRATGPSGEALVVTVLEVTDETVTLDANHPLAGEDLDFEIELVAIDEEAA